MIKNDEFIIKRSDLKSIDELPTVLEKEFGSRVLRWFISRLTESEIEVELTLSEKEEYLFPKDMVNDKYPGKSVVVNIIPTGIGCDIGGYAADAAPAASLLATCCDYVVTNPNTVNASNFQNIAENVLYTEGMMIDQFCKGGINLYLPYANKVGLIVEKSSTREMETIFNVINTARAVHGVDIEHVVITGEPVGGRCVRNKSGSYVGSLADPSILFKACDELIAKGVQAIGITTNIQDLPSEEYAQHFAGLHPNPVGGAEAIISHLIGAKYKVPSAHAPLTNIKEMDLEHNVVDARGAGEFSSDSGLACVLVGLSKAPQVEFSTSRRIKDIINIHNLLAIVAPSSALGGIPMLYAQRYGIPVIAVEENKTILDVSNQYLALGNVLEVKNYAEAAGIVQALRSGISLQSIYRPLKTLRF